jgi:predicted MFS family arabinose efflux permease
MLLINSFGWRNAYKFIGFFGILISLITLFLVKEPLRKIENQSEE